MVVKTMLKNKKQRVVMVLTPLEEKKADEDKTDQEIDDEIAGMKKKIMDLNGEIKKSQIYLNKKV